MIRALATNNPIAFPFYLLWFVLVTYVFHFVSDYNDWKTKDVIAGSHILF